MDINLQMQVVFILSKKTGYSWCYISRLDKTELWLCDNKFLTWRFIPTNRMTEEEFCHFCEFYNINVEDDKQLEIYNEIEFMDI